MVERIRKEVAYMILQGSCSELVVPLDIDNTPDLQDALEVIEEITKWRLCVNFWLDEWKTLHISPEDVIIDDDSRDKEITLWRDISFMDVKDEYYSIALTKQDIPFDSDAIYITYTDGYCSRTCTIRASQHCNMHHFEPLFRIAYEFNKIWHSEDGGNVYDINRWLAKNKRKEAIRYVKKVEKYLKDSRDLSVLEDLKLELGLK